MTEKELKAAHKHSFGNRKEIEASKLCGCFSCGRTFTPDKAEYYGDEEDGRQTAWCPYCSTDAVIGDVSGYELSLEFLNAMARRWFGYALKKDKEQISFLP